MSLHYDEQSADWVNKMNHKEYDSRAQRTIEEISLLGLKNSKKACRLLVNNMCKEKGFVRKDNRDYFVHPLAIAQTIIDFGIVDTLVNEDRTSFADNLIATALLHDIVEDVNGVTVSLIKEKFNETIATNVDNLSKREDKETFYNYIQRVSSSPISALVKILDRLNNVATLGHSTLKHREQQYEETMKIYVPLTKYYRHQYWEYKGIFWQVRTILLSLLSEINRANEFEEQLNDLKKTPIN